MYTRRCKQASQDPAIQAFLPGPSNATPLLAAEELAGERRCRQDYLRAGAREGVVPDADRIELADQVVLDDAGNVAIDFMGGRTDANNGNGTEILAPREYYNRTLISVRDNIKIPGVSPRGPRYPSEKEHMAEGKDVYMMDTDLALLAAPQLKEAVQLFASVECIFKHVFSSA
ncbi:Catalase/peroxidase HPI [Phytophthora cinnamomi]|uniref:Catalase/peroxidase HPI n=1 Tax=Phytophthora cinnamomi TaxID=4785 RepID=UPI003559BEF4|nr:Catalase/peroxidase HPI [Phytophthora cinnamomi]